MSDTRFNFKLLRVGSPTDDDSSRVNEIFNAFQTFGCSFVVQGDVHVRTILVYLDEVDLGRVFLGNSKTNWQKNRKLVGLSMLSHCWCR